MVNGAALRVAKALRDRGFAVCTGFNAVTGRHYYARTEAGVVALRLAKNAGDHER
jgi:hypothetical protein